jgi:peptidoglycan DL-endopeptidase CwlO
MATRRRTQRVSPGPVAAARRSPLRAVARPIAWSALISSIVLSIGVGPAHAEPVNEPGGQIPNSGVRPVTDRPLQMPGNAAPVAAAPALSPLAQQLITKQAEMEQAGERVKQLNLEHESARTNLAVADGNWKAAHERLTTAKTRADAEAAEAYKATVGLPPTVTSDLRGLSALSPLHSDDALGLGSARELLKAQQEEGDTYQAYLGSIREMEAKAQEAQAAQAEFKRREAAYLALRQQHADEIAAAEAERERRDQALGRQFVENGSLNGYAASKLARQAVNVALAQLGKPYVWGAEGPNSFDCSGLMWYSYLHGAGYSLPRVSRDQYNGTKSRTVSRYALLPGDLLFFATNPNDWTTVHHVGMYLGNGRMIHAPNSNDVVKISTVWWSEFFAATRVFGEVVSPPASTATTPPSSGGTSNPSPSRTPRPTTTTKPPVSTSPSSTPPSSTPPTTSSPSPTPTPTPTKSASPSPTQTSASPAATNTESTPAGGDTGSSAPATGSSESAASTEASGAATESPASDATSSSGS